MSEFSDAGLFASKRTRVQQRGQNTWKLNELAHRLLRKDRRSGLPALCGSTRSFEAPDPALVAGASVTFEPGARTAWHTHPLGQTLIVTAGCGWVQRKGGAIEEIRPGDVVWFAPGEKHWHGATPTTGMTHIAVQEKLDGKVVDWMEHVSDDEYRSGANQAIKKDEVTHDSANQVSAIPP